MSGRYCKVQRAIAEIEAGHIVVVVDSHDSDSAPSFAMAAQHVTPGAINFMAVHGLGLIRLALTHERADELELEPVTPVADTAFTVSIEARRGVTTGISAADRSHTIQVAIGPASTADDLTRPGHTFPVRARPNGVLDRTGGHAEAAVDLARLAGLRPAGVLCEVVDADGNTTRIADLAPLCERNELALVAATDLAMHRRQTEGGQR